jgi:CBS domain-containing protein
MSERFTQAGSYLTPRPAHARVADAMRHGIFSCPANTSLRDAARTMSLHHVHAVVVSDPANGSLYGVLTDSALLNALLDGDGERLLSEVADRDLNTISSSEPLLAAAELMRDRGITHLLVRDADSGQPTGMLSTMDVTGMLAWGEA